MEQCANQYYWCRICTMYSYTVCLWSLTTVTRYIRLITLTCQCTKASPIWHMTNHITAKKVKAIDNIIPCLKFYGFFKARINYHGIIILIIILLSTYIIQYAYYYIHMYTILIPPVIHLQCQKCITKYSALSVDVT
jgi:hypothetical protein